MGLLSTCTSGPCVIVVAVVVVVVVVEVIVLFASRRLRWFAVWRLRHANSPEEPVHRFEWPVFMLKNVQSTIDRRQPRRRRRCFIPPQEHQEDDDLESFVRVDDATTTTIYRWSRYFISRVRGRHGGGGGQNLRFMMGSWDGKWCFVNT